MTDSQSFFIDIAELRLGHFVYIDLGWLSHPFPLNAFRIRTQDQLDTILALGLERIRINPEKSEALQFEQPAPANSTAPVTDFVGTARRARAASLAAQRVSLAQCDRQFDEASQVYQNVATIFEADPELARQQCETMVGGLLDHLQNAGEASIRLLSEQVGEGLPLHSINVTVISLLLGKAMGLDATAMRDVGLGALLHDIGKLALPLALRRPNDHFTAAERTRYQEHVMRGLEDGRRMGLAAGALIVIAQHHEYADGSGFPRQLGNASLSIGGRIVGLVNRYDNLCNPSNPSAGLTPHEALSTLFVQEKMFFDGVVIGAFIRMMGIYPPGSVVQLTDDRYALVVSSNSARPLKPQVIIHQPEIPAEEALIVDLESTPELGIRRSLRPLQLAKAAIDYLSPRERICYFFERARPLDDLAGSP